MNKWVFINFLVVLVNSIIGQSIQKTMLRLPDTGQKTSYTNTFGEDNDYIINPPFFINNGNGTVTDTVTGLMWQQTDGGEMTIENAMAYCDSLTLAGYTNWRLPNPQESFSILIHQNANPALDPAAFTKTGAEYWWTNARQANDNTRVWVTNAGGGIGNHPKSETISAGGTKKIHVRAVRDINIPASVSNHFTDNGDGTITDHLTNLVWQKNPNPNAINWEQALTYAESLNLADSSDWRLPNIKELHSLHDESTVNPGVNTNFFPAIGVKKYWSSTSLPNQTTKAWYLDTQFGITTYDFKTSPLYVICVRGGSQKTITATHESNHNPSSIVIYPNPASLEIVILINTFDTNNYNQIALANQIGEVVYKKEINSIIKIHHINTQNLSNGFYYIQLYGNHVFQSHKVMIQN